MHLYGDYDNIFLSKEADFIGILKSMQDLSNAKNSRFIGSYLPANLEVYPKLIQKQLPGSTKYDENSEPSMYGSRVGEFVLASKIDCLDVSIT